MTHIRQLLANYERFVALPWSGNLAHAQRVWFAVYPPAEERRLRVVIQEFEVATRRAGHGWHLLDITALPEEWLAQHEYADGYFADPAALLATEEQLRRQVVDTVRESLKRERVDGSAVVAILGTGSLFGFTHVSSVLLEVQADIPGRLLVFFPGEYDNNRYRFMDARDGFNYMAAPITCAERFAI